MKNDININILNEKDNSTNWLWIIGQTILVTVLFIGMIFYDVIGILFVLNFIWFWIYTIYHIIKYDFNKNINKIVWLIIAIFLAPLTIYFPAFEKETVIK